jgi:hypothetical protein
MDASHPDLVRFDPLAAVDLVDWIAVGSRPYF